MLRFLAKRAAGIGITLLIATFLVFAINEYSAGNVARKILGPFSTPEQQELLNKALHLDDPLLVRYGRWMAVLLGLSADPLAAGAGPVNVNDPRGPRYLGNFGFSTLYQRPVNVVLGERLGNTAILAAIAFALIVPIGILLGLWMGLNAGKLIDNVLSAAAVTMTCMPQFAAGVFLSGIFVVWLGWLPGVSPLEPSAQWSWWQQMALPVAALVLVDAGYVARIVRASVADVAKRNFVKTAVLKGLPPHRMIFGEILPNAMIAPLTIILLQLNWLVTGVVVTETIFAYPGFGRMLLEAALFGDVAVVEAAAVVALILAIMTQLIGDVGYMLLNPRIRTGRTP